MASPALSSDEGEIIEATTLPRSEQNGVVDRAGRNRGRFSRSPERDSPSVHNRDGPSRRSRSPRVLKRARDDRENRRDSRQFRVHYEDSPREESRRARNLDDRPSPRGSHVEDYSRPRLRGYDDYSDKRARHRSRSPRDRRDEGRGRNSDRFGRVSNAEQNKYSAQNERPSQRDSMSKRATLQEPSDTAKKVAKSNRGVAFADGTKPESALDASMSGLQPGQDDEVDMDWDPDTVVDEEAAMEAEIQRRRSAREEALKRARGVGSNSQVLEVNGGAGSTPLSTRQNSPGPQKPRDGTPRSDSENSRSLSPSAIADASTPADLVIFKDEQLINTYTENKKHDEDGPSAADYDPTATMKEDERRDELRHGNADAEALNHATASQQAVVPSAEVGSRHKDGDGDDDDFDMFADDFDEKKVPVAVRAEAPKEDQVSQANGGGILEGDDKDGYYKIRPGELLDSRYQISTTLGRGMFSGVARALDVSSNRVFAIKIMRNNDALKKGGYTEIAILQKLNNADPDDKKHIVRFERSFEYRGHLCMAFENLSLNLREVLKKFGNNVGINLNATRAYAYQIFVALGHMRKCSIIHADLKPDNILVNEARNILKICDLGTAIDRSDAATAASTDIAPYLVSRFYRAPEIILGMPYDYAVDMWSIGCTLYELYTGKILFTGDSNNQMLKNIMEIRGKFSPKLYRRGQLAAMHFDEQGNFISVERDKILDKTTVRTLAVVKATRDLRTRVLAASSGMDDAGLRELNHFVDLLERCLTLNPERRIAPSEALRHPFFTHRVHVSGK